VLSYKCSMAARMGLLGRAWEKLRNFALKETFVGADAHGNRYYKYVHVQQWNLGQRCDGLLMYKLNRPQCGSSKGCC